MFRSDPREARFGVRSFAVPAGRQTVLAGAGAAGLFCAAALVGCGGWAATTKAMSCLRSHGWKVEQLSRGDFVATHLPYMVTYRSQEEPVVGFAPRSGGSGTLPPIRLEGCFPGFTVSFGGSGDRAVATKTVILSSTP